MRSGRAGVGCSPAAAEKNEDGADADAGTGPGPGVGVRRRGSGGVKGPAQVRRGRLRRLVPRPIFTASVRRCSA